MTHYRLTTRGKVVLGIFVLMLVALVVKGGIYISDLNRDVEVVAPEDTSSEVANKPEVPTEAETPEDSTVPVDPEEQTEPEPEKIYTVEELEDMKQMLFVFYFEKGQSDLNEESLEQLDILMEVLSAYPEEPIVIEGHVNGYPNFIQTEENLELSGERSQAITEFLMDRGIENSRITVYNFGSEVPYIRQSALQHQNDRVTVYFKNHFIKGDLNK
ncbi:MAG: OmpA family protein [Clostridiales bacterium]|nr:OmpA family protein [Clostridiales bacterium]